MKHHYGTFPRSMFIHPFACRDSDSVERSFTELRRSGRDFEGSIFMFHNNDLELMDFALKHLGRDFHEEVIKERIRAEALIRERLNLPPPTSTNARARL